MNGLNLDPAIWALIGVVLGAVLTGIINYRLQKSQFKHNEKMFFLQNKSDEKAKEILADLLNHRVFTDRSFTVIKQRVGGFSDDELRKLLIAIGAQRSSSRKEGEWWYLLERQQERIAKRKAKSKKDKSI